MLVLIFQLLIDHTFATETCHTLIDNSGTQDYTVAEFES